MSSGTEVLMRLVPNTRPGRYALAAGATVAIAAAGVGVATGAAGPANHGVPDVITDTYGVARDAPSPSLETGPFSGSHKDSYNLQPAEAKTVPAPSGEGTWTIVPGKTGICVAFTGGASLTCGPTSEVAAGKVVLISLPPSNRTHTDTTPGVVTKADPEDLVGDGPARFRGLAPDRFVSARILDRAGNVVGTTDIRSGVYELTAPNAREYGSVELLDTAGKPTTVLDEG